MAANGRMQRAIEPGKESASDGATARSSGENAEEKTSSERIQTI